MTPPKDHNNIPVIEPKDIEFCDLPKKDFKIPLLRNPVSHKTIQTIQQIQENGKTMRNLTKR